MRKLLYLAGVAVVAMLGVVSPADATLTLSPGLVGGSGDVDNVIFNASPIAIQHRDNGSRLP